MAVILQTRCFQMDNCEPDLSLSKYVEVDCFRWLYIYGHICDFLSRYAQLKQYILLQSEQAGDWHQMKATGPFGILWTDEYLQVVMTSQNIDLQELQILLKEGGFKLILAINTLSIFCEIPIRWIQHHTGHQSTMVQAMAWCRQAKCHYMSQCLLRSLAPYGVTRPQWIDLDIANHLLHVVWICLGNGLVPIRQQAFNRTHNDKDKMFKKRLHCINSNWKYVDYCNKKCTQVVWLIFWYETVDVFGIHDL